MCDFSGDGRFAGVKGISSAALGWCCLVRSRQRTLIPAQLFPCSPHWIASFMLLSQSAGVMACQCVMCFPLHEWACVRARFLSSYCMSNSRYVRKFPVLLPLRCTVRACVLWSFGGFLQWSIFPQHGDCGGLMGHRRWVLAGVSLHCAVSMGMERLVGGGLARD